MTTTNTNASTNGITIAEVERRLVEARLEFERTGDTRDRDVVLTLASAREKLRQAMAMAWARAADAEGESRLMQHRALGDCEAAGPKLTARGGKGR
jgi:hypothetical protein